MGKTGTSASLILLSVLQVSPPESSFFVYLFLKTPQFFRFTIISFWCLSTFWNVPLLYVLQNKTQLTFLPPTHKEVQELHISRKLSAREPAHGPQVKQQERWCLQIHMKAPNPPFGSCEGWLANSTFLEHLLTICQTALPVESLLRWEAEQAPLSHTGLNIHDSGHRTLEHSRLEGTSKCHLLQPFEKKGDKVRLPTTSPVTSWKPPLA